MNVNELQVKKLQVMPGLRGVSWYRVSHAGRVVGFVEKLRNTRSVINPWKAFAADHGTFGRYLGAHYGGMNLALGLIIDII
jgi:hypothetical protein